MRVEQLNRVSTAGLVILSFAAFLTVVPAAFGVVLSGQLPPRETDEGTGAHVFQMSVGALLPMGLLFLATSDWAQPSRIVRRLALPVAIEVVAFAVLYYFEHFLHRP